MYSITNTTTILKYNGITIGWSVGPSSKTNTVINATENITRYKEVDTFFSAGYRSGRMSMFVPRFSIDALNINSNPYIQYTYTSATG